MVGGGGGGRFLFRTVHIDFNTPALLKALFFFCKYVLMKYTEFC